MYKEVFPIFIEVQSLENSLFSHEKKINSHKQRIIEIEKRREGAQNSYNQFETELPKLRSEINTQENTLTSLEQKLEKSEEHLQIAKTAQQIEASENEIKIMSEIKDKCEVLVLNLMEKVEKIEESLEESSTFLTGSLETLETITQEVAKDVKAENKEISFYQERITTLLEDLAPNLQAAFNAVNKKYKNDNPVSIITDKKCGECFTGISSNIETQIQQGLLFEYCTGCGRILAPYQG